MRDGIGPDSRARIAGEQPRWDEDMMGEELASGAGGSGREVFCRPRGGIFCDGISDMRFDIKNDAVSPEVALPGFLHRLPFRNRRSGCED